MTKKRAVLFFLIAAAVLFVDMQMKGWIRLMITPIQFAPPMFPFGGISICENFFGIDFCLNNASNRGMAWGFLSRYQEWLLVARIAVVGGLFIYAFRSPKAIPYHFPLALVVGGAVGNILDYFLYGHVVDMFHFIFWGYSYPIFNIADSAIFCGVAWMILKSIRQKRHALLKTQ